VRRAHNLTTFMCRLSRNLGALTSWKPKSLPRPVFVSHTIPTTRSDCSKTNTNYVYRFNSYRAVDSPHYSFGSHALYFFPSSWLVTRRKSNKYYAHTEMSSAVFRQNDRSILNSSKVHTRVHYVIRWRLSFLTLVPLPSSVDTLNLAAHTHKHTASP
jgi:hypothetical protein